MPIPAGVEVREERARGCGFRKVGGTYLMCTGRAAACCRLPFDLSVCPCCSQGIKPSRAWTWVDLGLLLGGKRMECVGDPASAVALSLAATCPLADPKPGTRVGLLWIGGKFYKTPADFCAEANQMGISRRIPAVPKDFVLGETWVLFAHRAGRTEPCTECQPLRKRWAEIVGAKAARDVAAMGDAVSDTKGTEAEEAALAELQGQQEACETCGGTGAKEIATVFGFYKPTAIERVVDENVTQEEVDALKKRGIQPVIVKPIVESQAELQYEGAKSDEE